MVELDALREALSNPRGQAGDDWNAIQARLGDDPVALLGELIPRAVIDDSDPAAPRDPVTVARLENGVRVLVRLAAAPGAAVTDDERADLELLAQIAGRPAISVRGGTFVAPPPQWKFLADDRKRIDARIASVGRIDAPAGVQIGTGFVVSAGMVMTNRHVHRDLVTAGGGTFPANAVIDFDRELDGASRTARIVDVVWVSDDKNLDLALLRIDGAALPPPLYIQSTAPDTVDKRLVYAIGYPFSDNAGTTPAAVMAAVFRDALGIKRMQPGLLRGLDTVDARRVAHDCSTLGGSSGSCVIDYTTGLVCGLHFSGRFRERNLAVALWTVATHAKIAPYVQAG